MNFRDDIRLCEVTDDWSGTSINAVMFSRLFINGALDLGASAIP